MHWLYTCCTAYNPLLDMPAPKPSSTASTPSARLARALDAEREDLTRRVRQLQRERRALLDRLAAAEAEIQVVDERLVLLARLRGEEADRPAETAVERPLLTGPAIRMAAVALLRDHPEGQGPIYYRRWLELIEQAGFEVGGRRPAATLLSQLTRSPVVRRTSRSGHYEIDREAPARLRRRVELLRTRMGGAPNDDGSPVDLEAVRRSRESLTREIEKAERELAEATAALTLPASRVSNTG